MTAGAYRIRLHVVSPIHVGCGEVYEPTTFYIEKSAEKLVTFDPLDFVAGLRDADRKRFSDVCMGTSLLAVMKTVRSLSAGVPAVSEVSVVSAVAERYEKVLMMTANDPNQVINLLTINRTAYSPNGEIPYIPGSSLKGSIRTALLDHLNHGQARNIQPNRAKDLEIDLLGGSFSTDPFRLVKVPDLLPAGDLTSKVLFAVNVKKRQSGAGRGIPQILEAVLPGSIFEGVLRIEESPRGSDIKRPVIPGELFAAVNKFFETRLHRESEELLSAGFTQASDDLDAGVAAIRKEIGAGILVRLGRHSGAEAMTLEGNRQIKILGKRGERPITSDKATTLWLASDSADSTSRNNMHPFGWAIMEALPYAAGETWANNSYHDQLRKERSVRKAAESSFPPAVCEAPRPTPRPAPADTSRIETWEGVLSWSPGNGILTLAAEGRKAIRHFKTKEERAAVVPEALHAKLFEKKKDFKARAEVRVDGNQSTVLRVLS